MLFVHVAPECRWAPLQNVGGALSRMSVGRRGSGDPEVGGAPLQNVGGAAEEAAPEVGEGAPSPECRWRPPRMSVGAAEEATP